MNLGGGELRVQGGEVMGLGWGRWWSVANSCGAVQFWGCLLFHKAGGKEAKRTEIGGRDR